MSGQEHIAEMRRIVDEAPDRSVPECPRKCENCGGGIYLTCGSRSGKWFWSHQDITDCVHDGPGRRLFFDSKDEAENAAEIWKRGAA